MCSNIDKEVFDRDDDFETLVIISMEDLEIDCRSFTLTPSDDFDNLNEASKTMLMSVPPSYFTHLQKLLSGSNYIPIAERKYLRYVVDYLASATNKALYDDILQPSNYFVKYNTRLYLLRLVTFWKETLCQKIECEEAASSSNTLFTLSGEVKAHFRSWIMCNSYSAVTHKSMDSREYFMSGKDTEDSFRSKLSSFLNGDLPLDVNIIYRKDTITDCSSNSIR